MKRLLIGLVRFYRYPISPQRATQQSSGKLAALN